MNLANWKKTIYYLRRNGIKNTFYAVCERLQQKRAENYCYKEPDSQTLTAQRNHDFKVKPLFSIVVPLYRTPKEYLVEMIDSVLCQTYDRLELILADATEDDSVECIVRECYAAEVMTCEPEACGAQEGITLRSSGRIRYCRLERNGGISENSNQALAFVTGDYVGLLDHDDVLTPDALYEMAVQIERMSREGHMPMLLYSDEDKCNQDRTAYYEPHFKLDFNFDLLLSNNYICHFLVMKRELIQSLGFRREYDGAQDFDLVLRAVEQILSGKASEGSNSGVLRRKAEGDIPWERQIVHIPKVLYHWRCHTGSTAENPQSKQYAYEAGKRALQDMARRMGWNAEAVHLKHLGFYGLKYEPNLLTVRKDVGAVGGKLMLRGRIAGGAYKQDGQVLYQGLKEGYSGYMHRGVLLQDVDAVDIRLIQVSPACRDIFQRVVGVPYVTAENDCFDWTVLPEGTDYVALSLKLGGALRDAGYRVCWDPGVSSNLGIAASDAGG